MDHKQKKEIEAAAVIVLSLLMTILATFLLPETILSNSKALSSSVNGLAQWVPSIRRLGQMSEFPEVSQLVYSVELICVPLIVFWMLRSFDFSVNKMPSSRWRSLVAAPFFLAMTLGVLIYFPGSPDGEAPSSRVSKVLLESKLGFAFWSVVLVYALSIFIVLAYAWVKAIPEIFGLRNKKI